MRAAVLIAAAATASAAPAAAQDRPPLTVWSCHASATCGVDGACITDIRSFLAIADAPVGPRFRGEIWVNRADGTGRFAQEAIAIARGRNIRDLFEAEMLWRQAPIFVRDGNMAERAYVLLDPGPADGAGARRAARFLCAPVPF